MRDDFRAWVEQEVAKKGGDAVKESLFQQKYKEHGVGEVDYIIRERQHKRMFAGAVLLLLAAASVAVLLLFSAAQEQQNSFAYQKGLLIEDAPRSMMTGSAIHQTFVGTVVHITESELVLTDGATIHPISLANANLSFVFFSRKGPEAGTKELLSYGKPATVALTTDLITGRRLVRVTQ